MFPYEFLGSVEKLQDNKKLKKENVYSSLNNENISDEYSQLLFESLENVKRKNVR